jgi:hypothetical protein
MESVNHSYKTIVGGKSMLIIGNVPSHLRKQVMDLSKDHDIITIIKLLQKEGFKITSHHINITDNIKSDEWILAFELEDSNKRQVKIAW